MSSCGGRKLAKYGMSTRARFEASWIPGLRTSSSSGLTCPRSSRKILSSGFCESRVGLGTFPISIFDQKYLNKMYVGFESEHADGFHSLEFKIIPLFQRFS
jgi:hypothetical protein